MVSLADILLGTSLAALLYYVLVNGLYLLVHVAALFELRSDYRRHSSLLTRELFASPFVPGVSIIVPAYNEADVILDNVQSLLNVHYPDVEIVVVNDGSEDETLDRLREEYDLVPIDAPVPFDVPTEPIHAVYRAETTDLVVIDKANGGRADAVNAAIWLTDQPLFCTIDADSLIDREGLLQAVRPFLEHPEETVATGGTVRVVNGCGVTMGNVSSVELPANTLAELQTMEYLRAFYSGRMGLDRLNSLLLISGAFGVFRTDVVRRIGGYQADSVTEDFELTMRLHRHFRETDQAYNIEFVPEPVVWTEVPESLAALSRQRRRWYRGLIDTVVRHRDMIGRQQYGSPGLFGSPAFVFAEVLGPLVEGFGYVVTIAALVLGFATPEYVLTYFAITIGVGVFLSWFGILSEVWSFRRYDRPRQVLRLLGDGVLENFGYRQWKTFVRWRGLIEYVRGDSSWGEMDRRGFDD
jgi:cellulose synthase/poly-beta-1,6-N-acetylglucosamine synthase-like glycosyltransferase